MIYLATDHAGFKLKEKLKVFLKREGYEMEDLGALELDEKDDYPDFISLAAQKISVNPENKAIIFGGSGQGEAIVANRFSSVRAIVYYGGPIEIIKLSREHNDANILSLGARFLTEEGVEEVVKMWLETPFSGEARHQRRINKINLLGDPVAK